MNRFHERSIADTFQYFRPQLTGEVALFIVGQCLALLPNLKKNDEEAIKRLLELLSIYE